MKTQTIAGIVLAIGAIALIVGTTKNETEYLEFAGQKRGRSQGEICRAAKSYMEKMAIVAKNYPNNGSVQKQYAYAKHQYQRACSPKKIGGQVGSSMMR